MTGKIISLDCNDYDINLVDRVISRMLDFSMLNFSGRSVFIKPNMLSASPPSKGVTTHPVFITSIIKAVRARGAKEVKVGDNPGMTGYGASEKAGKVSGIIQASNGCFVNIAGSGVRINVNGLHLLISKEILDADIIINLPRFKTHSITGFTGAIKNMFGIVIGSDKLLVHRELPNPERFSQYMADVCAVRLPDFSIIDGIYVMEGNGPSAGRLRKYGKVLASTDPVALDAVAMEIAGIPAHKSPMIERAKSLGMGTTDNILIEGKVEKIPGFKLPATIHFHSKLIEILVGKIGMNLIPDRVPSPVKKRCTGCSQCLLSCPVGALTLKEKKPAIDLKKCIRCYCCMEICTENAWKLKLKIKL